jgi:hypothetical protein
LRLMMPWENALCGQKSIKIPFWASIWALLFWHILHTYQPFLIQESVSSHLPYRKTQGPAPVLSGPLPWMAFDCVTRSYFTAVGCFTPFSHNKLWSLDLVGLQKWSPLNFTLNSYTAAIIQFNIPNGLYYLSPSPPRAVYCVLSVLSSTLNGASSRHPSPLSRNNKMLMLPLRLLAFWVDTVLGTIPVSQQTSRSCHLYSSMLLNALRG